jgi:hypothetical protein
MKNRILPTLFLLAALLIGQVPLVAAQQIRLIESSSILIANPEVQQTFYNTLDREAHFYTINAQESFHLKARLMVPKTDDAEKDFRMEITNEHGFEELVDGREAEWEEFLWVQTGDEYWMGPEFDEEVDAGEYILKVASPDLQGQYALRVGEEELLPFSEIVNTIQTLPTVKTEFFGKSSASAYSNVFGLYLLGGIVGFVFLVGLGWVFFTLISKKF